MVSERGKRLGEREMDEKDDGERGDKEMSERDRIKIWVRKREDKGLGEREMTEKESRDNDARKRRRRLLA